MSGNSNSLLSGGIPTGPQTNTKIGIHLPGKGSSFKLAVKADTITSRTGNAAKEILIGFKAGSAGMFCDISWIMEEDFGGGSITLQASTFFYTPADLDGAVASVRATWEAPKPRKAPNSRGFPSEPQKRLQM